MFTNKLVFIITQLGFVARFDSFAVRFWLKKGILSIFLDTKNVSYQFSEDPEDQAGHRISAKDSKISQSYFASR